MRRFTTIITTALLLAACAGGAGGADGGPDATARTTGGNSALAGETTPVAGGAGGGGKVDPRDGGLDVALGEWAVTLEAGAIRPGEVTFVVANRGTIQHGFEIELEEEDDSSGSGSGDDELKAETNLLRSGETTKLTMNLPAGLYKVECLVPGHDDLGMEGFLEVREDAPLVRSGGGASADAVSIANFAFDPAELQVAAGTEVTWTNDDQAPHTVTADGGGFDSGTLDPGDTFSVAVEGNGPVTYACMIHPEMTGSIVVG
jgi:plastocyanin